MKKIKIVLLGGLLLWSLLSVAQDRSIAFESISFQEALNKAKQNNKLLFVDCYTSWCEPCKMLAKEVFTNNEVADDFNEHFVALKVYCEKGEGPELRKRFGVESYPILLFIDGEGEVVNKIGETLHPYLFGFSCGHSKSENEQDFETYKALVDRYQPKQKETLYIFIELGRSANFDDFNGYFKTVMKTIPKLDKGEHYRFFANALDSLIKGANSKQKQQLLALLKESQIKQTDYFKPLYQIFFDKIEKS